MIAKLHYQYLESVLLKFIRAVLTRELSQHFRSLKLLHRVLLAVLRPRYFVFSMFLSQPGINKFLS